MKKSSLLLSLILLMIGTLAATAPAPAAAGTPTQTQPAEEIYLGLGEATPGENGWIVSDYIIHVISPADTLVNGNPIQNGRFTITSDGRHAVKLQPGPFGQKNTVTQFINIDKTAPTVKWITGQNLAVSGWADLSAEISDETSGLCSVDSSFDHGLHWDTHNLAALTPDGVTIQHETTWSLHRNFHGFLPLGAQVVLLRAHDCAGNVSPGEVLVIRVQ